MTEQPTIPTESTDDDRFLRHFLPGEAEAMRVLRTKIAVITRQRSRAITRNILICGPSGAGKNYVANVIAGHAAWLADAGLAESTKEDFGVPLEAYTSSIAEISIPGLPEELVQSELFGHRKGAFTGAVSDREGYFAGDYEFIFLDEIAEASLNTQAKLLQVLNTGQYRPLGSTLAKENTKARVLLATNADLQERVAERRFRDDLLWRAREFVLHVPPLVERGSDHRHLADSIIRRIHFRLTDNYDGAPQLSDDDREFIRQYSWPGNVRQMEHVIRRWIIHECRKPLRAAVAEVEAEFAATVREAPGSSGSVAAMVQADLSAAMADGTPLSGTLAKYSRSIADRAESALAQAIRAQRLGPDRLKVLFPDYGSLRSLSNAVSRAARHE